MKYLSLFSGIGGFEVGIHEHFPDAECIGFSEIDKYAISIYQKHFPDHKLLGDITNVSTEEIENFDLLVGGFPCQAFSIAGKKLGFEDTRGTLFFEIVRILKDKKPKYFILENVKNLLSHEDGRTFSTVLEVLAEVGYDVEWCLPNSKFFGVPQNRERVFFIGSLRGERRWEIFPR